MKEPTMISKLRRGRCGNIMVGVGVLLFTLVLLAPQAQAMIFDTGNSNIEARFDNTITYSVMTRLLDQKDDYLANPNGDDATRNFNKGLVMNRFDLLSEFDFVYKRKFGLRVSGAAWNDFVYLTDNDNDSPETFNAISVPHDEFTDETRKWHGRSAELLEAFTFGTVDLGDMKLRYRVGQLSQWWGDSFFLGWNGVAGALAPVNVAKAASLPNVQLKELILPIPQAYTALQITDRLTVNAYYQFEWKPARLFAYGSYWSPADLIGPGAEQIFGPGFLKTDDMEAKDDGQFGVNVRLETMAASLGLYYNKFHSKDFYVVVMPIDGQYTFFYPEDIESYAATANVIWGSYTFAAEVTYRDNVPMHTNDQLGLTVFPNFGPFVDMPHEPLYATGQTLSILLNTFAGGMRGNFFCDSQDLIAEVAYVTEVGLDNEELLAEGYDKDGLMAKVNYTPKWYQVMDGLDLTLPMSIEYAFKGKPSTILWGGSPDKGGAFNIGVGGTYMNLWDFELTYRTFYGDTDYQPHVDRDYVSFFIRRAF